MTKRSRGVMRGKKRGYVLPLLAVIVVVLGITALIAGIWQKAEDLKYKDSDRSSYAIPKELKSTVGLFGGLFGEKDKDENEPTEPEEPDEPTNPDEPREPAEPENTDEIAPDELNEPTEPAEPAEPATPTTHDYTGQVKESTPMDKTFFNDAVFIGDSLTEGIKAYALMENATVLAHQGINIDSILTKEAISFGGGRITIPEALRHQDKVGKIYVMIGANGIAWMDNATFVKKYSALIDTLKECAPTADIYIESMLPVNEQIISEQGQYEPISNSDINALNESILDLALEKEVYFVNVAEAFVDEYGSMPREATPDGIHLNAPYYQKWFDYLLTHTVNNGG